MARKKLVKSVVVALSIAFVTSSIMILVSPRVQGDVWTETTDVDFNNNTAISSLTVVGTGSSAYMALIKDLYNWFDKNPGSAPTARHAFPMVWDSYHGKAFLFGGLDSLSNALNDTWEYSFATNTWTQLQANAPPPARYYASMAFDSIHSVAVLYGGYDKDSVLLDDTWEWDAPSGTWLETTPSPRPMRMTDNPMTFDSDASRVILAGQGLVSWETWAYNVLTHTWAQRTGSPTNPAARSGHRIVYYPDIQRTVLYGGAQMMTLWRETWEYDYTADNWINQTGNTGSDPGARTSYGFVYTLNPTVGNQLILFGGPGSPYPTDTWRYYATGSTRFWYSISTPGAPTGRTDFGMAFNTVNSTVVLFGGKNQAGARLADTWSFEPAYRTQGTYASKVFNSHYGNTVYQYLFWNQTPADVPTGGLIRFRIATNNIENPSDPSWVFRGPDGGTGTWYTTPGTAIWSLASGYKYLMYSIQVQCSGCTDSPQVQDVSVQYYAPQVPPTVITKGPVTAGTPLYYPPITTPIWINFSEPMNTAQVTVVLNPGNVPLTYTWTDPDTSKLYLTHSQDLNYCTAYTPTITQAVDQQGQSMTGLPYSWIFVTVCPMPEITSVYPPQGSSDIPLSTPIWANFSKPMNTSSVTVNVTPALGGTVDNVWSNGNKSLKVTHSVLLTEGTIYEVNITGKDTNDKFLIPGLVPNPWNFQSRFTSVRVLSTTPFDQTLEVPLTDPVVIQFSHIMNTTSVNVAITPALATSKTWNAPTNDTVTLTHTTPFTNCSKYTFNVTGRDTLDNNLIGGYYSFWIYTTCGGSPFIVITEPFDKSIDVALDQNIQILFYETMVRASVTFTVQPSDWTWTVNWTNMDMVMTLEHVTPFQGCTKYYVNITNGRDLDENKALAPGPVPNHFSFDTVCINPFVRSIVPPNGALDVALNQNIIVTFSKSMNTSSFMYRLIPDPGLIGTWNGPWNTVFTLSHPPLFSQSTTYNLTLVFAEDKNGNQLIGPRQFNFTTVIGTNPHVIFTDPSNKQTDVPLNKSIIVTFDKAMDNPTVTWNIIPSIALQKSFSPDFMTLTLAHSVLFSETTTYNITINGCDTTGNCLVPGPVPNPWEFTTLSVRPVITKTDPADLATDVLLTKTIQVDFSKSMDPDTFTQTVTPPGITFTERWQNNNKTVQLSHTALFSACTTYNVTITGSDTSGNALKAGSPSVPNPWKFQTTCIPGFPPGLAVLRVGNDIQLTWRAPLGGLAAGYRVYDSQDRLAAFTSWTMIGNVTTTSFTHTNANISANTYFYIVRAYNALWYEGPNSTMGVKLSRTFTFNAGGTNTQWFGLPYHTIYTKASDIVRELTISKIDVIAKWDSDKQESVLYYYLNGKWRGKDFAISSGDGLWLGVVSTFTWPITGTDRLANLQFVFKSGAQTHVNWMSLPYTTSYVNAKSISDELTNLKIIEVGRYNPATNRFEKWYWSGSTWIGTNFAIMPGDAIYVVIVMNFSWVPKLITPEVP